MALLPIRQLVFGPKHLVSRASVTPDAEDDSEIPRSAAYSQPDDHVGSGNPPYDGGAGHQRLLPRMGEHAGLPVVPQKSPDRQRRPQLRRHLLTSMLSVGVTAGLVLGASLAVSIGTHLVWPWPELVTGLGLIAALVGCGVALAQARRIARGVRDLTRAAESIGLGNSRLVGRRYGIGELDKIAEALDRASERVTDLMIAEQDFAVDASHQLRTPLIALSMRLEEIIEAADDPGLVREEGAAALAQTDRLAQVVGQLLGRPRRSSLGAPQLCGLDEIINQQVTEWEPAFGSENRRLVVEGERGLQVLASSARMPYVLATLLDNALEHGGGTVTIRTARTPRSVVEVRDEGQGVPQDLVHRIFERSVSGAVGTGVGLGLGLGLAKSIIWSDGGQLVLVRPQPATFAVIFPKPTQEKLDPQIARTVLKSSGMNSNG